MVVFPNFSNFYEQWRKDLVKRGVNVRLSTEITRVLKRDETGVVVCLIKRTPAKDSHNPNSAWVPYDRESNADADAKEDEEYYDEIVLCVLYVNLPTIPSIRITYSTITIAPTLQNVF